MIVAQLVHLGLNIGARRTARTTRTCDEGTWRRVTERMAARGFNAIVIDLLEGVRYASHPELAVSGAWSVEKLRRELARLRGLGLEPIPKLNFSATHDEWLGDYGRMLSTSAYYRVCDDLVREIVEIFDHPRLFHLGHDEEDLRCQGEHETTNLRLGELWWHDLLTNVRSVERAGSRAWVWADALWERPDYLARMPRSVVQSNWYYDDTLSERAFRWPRVKAYLDLDRAGFDQIPCATNFVQPRNAYETVAYCRRNLDPARLLGFLQSSWVRTEAANEPKILAAVDQMADALAGRPPAAASAQAMGGTADGGGAVAGEPSREAARQKTGIRAIGELGVAVENERREGDWWFATLVRDDGTRLDVTMLKPPNVPLGVRPALYVTESADAAFRRARLARLYASGRWTRAVLAVTPRPGTGSPADLAARAEDVLVAARHLSHRNAGRTVELLAEPTLEPVVAAARAAERFVFSTLQIQHEHDKNGGQT